MAAPESFAVLVAQWVLGRLTPAAAVARAEAALLRGCEIPSVIDLAGASRGATRVDLGHDIAAACRALEVAWPDEDRALKLVVDDCATQIAKGTIDPINGACVMWDLWANVDESSQFVDQLRPFIDIASEVGFAPETEQARKRDAVAAAESLLRRGGLQSKPR